MGALKMKVGKALKVIVCSLMVIICRSLLLRRSLRWIIRIILHNKRLPGWLDWIMTRISGQIPIDDIVSFVEYNLDSKIMCVTKPSDHWVVQRLYWRGCAFVDPETIKIFCKRARYANSILDIGSNWGYYTLLAASIAPGAYILAFEPHPFWFERLNENVKANQFKNVCVENLAVGKNDEFVNFFLDNDNPSASSMVKTYVKPTSHESIINVNCCSIDSYVLGHRRYRKIDLVKIDVELFEWAVLAGMEAVLQECRPDIICEVLPDETDTIDIRIANREAIQDILTEFGYKFYWISDRGLVREEEIEGHYPFSNYLFTTDMNEV